MSQPLFLILASMLCVGALLAFLSWRGRRINRVPACRDCNFDLTGVAGITCPECGAGLRRPRAIRIGQRRRVWTAFVLGLLLILGSAPLLALGFFAATTQRNLDFYKPFKLLTLEARYGSQSAVDAASTELKRRYDAGLLSPESKTAVIDLALDIQADRTAAWSPLFGDLIEADWFTALSQPQRDRYLENVVQLTITARDRVRIGGIVPVQIELSHLRAGTNASFPALVRMPRATIAGEAVSSVWSAWASMATGNFSPWASLSGASDQWRSLPPQWSSEPIAGVWTIGYMYTDSTNLHDVALIGLPASEALVPGEHPVQLELRLSCMNMGLSTATGTPPAPYLAAPPATLTREVLVQFTNAPVVRVQPATPESDARMIEGVKVSLTQPPQLSFVSTSPQQYIAIDTSSTPFPLAHEVFLHIENRDYYFGMLISGAGSGDVTTMLPFSMQGEQVGPTTRANGARYTLVLRPNLELAESSMTLDAMYGGTLEIDVTSTIFGDSPTPELDAVTRSPREP